ncbi:hypothetical protein TURU_123082 [Turdus rufiventris]|nr:hypothetical protein TURU_123082 [Turdus rufiventris]
MYVSRWKHHGKSRVHYVLAHKKQTYFAISCKNLAKNFPIYGIPMKTSNTVQGKEGKRVCNIYPAAFKQKHKHKPSGGEFFSNESKKDPDLSMHPDLPKFFPYNLDPFVVSETHPDNFSLVEDNNKLHATWFSDIHANKRSIKLP